MNVFLTGNQQFGRMGAIRKYKRPFDNVEEMNQHLIEQWNSVVSEKDLVFVLGNFVWDPETAEEIYRKLNGQICVFDGEHDTATYDVSNNSSLNIDFIEEGIHILKEAKICLSYWPLNEWPRKSKGWPSVIGYPDKKYDTSHKLNRLNVACDFWDYKPVKASRILGLFEDLKSEDR